MHTATRDRISHYIYSIYQCLSLCLLPRGRRTSGIVHARCLLDRQSLIVMTNFFSFFLSSASCCVSFLAPKQTLSLILSCIHTHMRSLEGERERQQKCLPDVHLFLLTHMTGLLQRWCGTTVSLSLSIQAKRRASSVRASACTHSLCPSLSLSLSRVVPRV